MLSDTTALGAEVEPERRHFTTGDHVVGEYQCSGCGYGVAIRRELPLCPMCGGDAWESAAWSPFSRAR